MTEGVAGSLSLLAFLDAGPVQWPLSALALSSCVPE